MSNTPRGIEVLHEDFYGGTLAYNDETGTLQMCSKPGGKVTFLLINPPELCKLTSKLALLVAQGMEVPA